MINFKSLFLSTLVALCAGPVFAQETVKFDGSWKEQGFLRFFSNDYIQRGRQLDVISDGTVSMLWRRVEPSLRGTKMASWAWRVRKGVAATDLTVKGGDDRNLAVYFVFVDADRADALSGGNARQVLREDSARALIYVWGGSHSLGSVLPSPYSPRLRTKVLRGVELGEHRESVDLAGDFRTAFGEEPTALIALAISADSDDTDSSIVGSIADLLLR